MYSPTQILRQEPAGIVTALSGLNAAALGMGWYHLTDVQLGLWSTAVLGLLTLFYIRPSTVTKDALQQVNDAQLEAIDLGKQIAPVTNITQVMPTPIQHVVPPPPPAKVAAKKRAKNQ